MLFRSNPSWYGDGTETPGYKVFKMFQAQFGDRLIDSYSDGFDFRMYTMRNSATGDITVWALNFSDDTDKTVSLSFANIGAIRKVTQKKLARLAVDTSLFDTNDPPPTAPPNVEWADTDLTASFTPEATTVTFDDATVTVLVIESDPVAFPPAKRFWGGACGIVGLEQIGRAHV